TCEECRYVRRRQRDMAIPKLHELRIGAQATASYARQSSTRPHRRGGAAARRTATPSTEPWHGGTTQSRWQIPETCIELIRDRILAGRPTGLRSVQRTLPRCARLRPGVSRFTSSGSDLAL